MKGQLFLVKKKSLVEFGTIYFRRHVDFLEQMRQSLGIPPKITSLSQSRSESFLAFWH